LCCEYYFFFTIIKSINIKNILFGVINIIIFIIMNIINKINTKLEKKNLFLILKNNYKFDFKGKIKNYYYYYYYYFHH
jgi:hypothetical protein